MRRIITTVAVGAALMALMASCNTTKSMSVSELGGRWEITSVNGNAVEMTAPDAEIPFLGFDTASGRVSGNAGCNSIMGGFTAVPSEGKISFDKIASTRMMCPDMTFEQSVLQALDKVTGYKNEGSGRMVLLGADGKGLISLSKVNTEVSGGELQGTWLIRTLDGKVLSPTPEATYSVTFDAGKRTFSCATGCNILGGTFASDKSGFKFDLSTSTMMMCPDMSVEDTLKKVLPTVTNYGRTPDGIGFYAGNGDLILEIVK